VDVPDGQGGTISMQYGDFYDHSTYPMRFFNSNEAIELDWSTVDTSYPSGSVLGGTAYI